MAARAYGRAMDTFCGCDTAALDDLSSMVGERAAHLGAVMEGVAQVVATTDWFGPDEQGFQEQLDEVYERARELFERLRELGELLREESAEQSACSQPDGQSATWRDGLRALRTELPRAVAELGLAPPVLGGPFMMEDPIGFVDRLPPLPDLGALGPLIGGPLLPSDPLRPVPPPPPLPEGEEFALDPEILAETEQDRRVMLGALPVIGTAQLAMGIHGGVGRFYDHVEETLEASGLGATTPLISMARIPHHVAGIPLGEKSIPAQALDVVDRQFANVAQTSAEVSSAVGEGDWAGATRAAERGIFRHIDASVDLMTANPAPAIAEAAAGAAGSAADIAEPFSPAAAEPLRDLETTVREAGAGLENGHHWLTDGERYYDLRRQYAPLPWDPQD